MAKSSKSTPKASTPKLTPKAAAQRKEFVKDVTALANSRRRIDQKATLNNGNLTMHDNTNDNVLHWNMRNETAAKNTAPQS